MEFPNFSSAKYVCIDIETYDPHLKDMGVSYIRGEGEILGVAIGVDNVDSWYYPFCNELVSYLRQLKRPIVGFNLPYDLGWLRHCSIDLLGNQLFDAMSGPQVIDNSLPYYNLDYLSKLWLGQEKVDLSHKYGKDWKNKMYLIPQEEIAIYAKKDVMLTMALHEYEIKQFDKYDLWKAYELECKLIPIIIQMKQNGVKLDLAYIQELKKKFKEMQFQLLMEVKRETNIYDIQIWSARSIAKVFDRLKIPYPRTDQDNPSFTGDWLDSCFHPIAQTIHRIRQLDKLRSTFLEGLERLQINGRVHPDYYAGRSDDGGTISARFSCAHPNKQQIPTRTEEGALIRRCFVADTDTQWGHFDYSQQEPRLSIHYASQLGMTGIEYWVDKYREHPETDFYSFILGVASIERQDAKTITLARSYGMGWEKLSRKLNRTMQESKDILAKFDRYVPWMKELMTKCSQVAADRGYLKSFLGRRFMYMKDKPYIMFNRLIQGAAAEQTKQAMVGLYENLKLVPLSQIHDELNYPLDTDGLKITIKTRMENTFKLDIPAKVDVGIAQNWGDAKKVAV